MKQNHLYIKHKVIIRGVAELLSEIINNSRVWRKFFRNVSPQLNGGFQNCTVMCYRVAVGTFGSAPVFWEVCLKKIKMDSSFWNEKQANDGAGIIEPFSSKDISNGNVCVNVQLQLTTSV